MRRVICRYYGGIKEDEARAIRVVFAAMRRRKAKEEETRRKSASVH